MSAGDHANTVRDSNPPSRWLKRTPIKTTSEVLTNLAQFRELPEGRTDLYLPDDDDVETTLGIIHEQLSRIKVQVAKSPDMLQALANDPNALSKLTDDHYCILMVNSLEAPYPWYRLVTAWMIGDRRDPAVEKHVGPYARLYIDALMHCPIASRTATRSMKVQEIPSLVRMFANPTVHCKAGAPINFWGLSSFTVNDAVLGDKAYAGDAKAQTIIYKCDALPCVDISPFSLFEKDEQEVMPVPPAMFVATGVFFSHPLTPNHLFIPLKYCGDDKYAYIQPPVKATPSATAAPAAKVGAAPSPPAAKETMATLEDMVRVPTLQEAQLLLTNDWSTFLTRFFGADNLPLFCSEAEKAAAVKQVERMKSEVKALGGIVLPVADAVRIKFQKKVASMPRPNIKFLWHGTSSARCAGAKCRHAACSLCSIASQGFRPDLARVNTGSYSVWGKSTYFADNAAICHGYNGQSEDLVGSGCRMVILCAVALGDVLDTDWVYRVTNLMFSDDLSGSNDSEWVESAQSVDFLYEAAVGRPATRDENVFHPNGYGSAFPRRPEPNFSSIMNKQGKQAGGGGPTTQHYMVFDPDLMLPLYALTYTYPKDLADSMPEEVQGRKKDQSKMCPFHRMQHLGEPRGQCDASTFHNVLNRTGCHVCSLPAKP